MKQWIFRSVFVMGLLGLIQSQAAFAKSKEVEPKVKGSITANGLSQADFPKVARISAADAGQIAASKLGGSTLSVGLENEDGYLVYAVEVVGSKSGRHEVLVDAGDGKILSDMNKAYASNQRDDGEDGEQDDD